MEWGGNGSGGEEESEEEGKDWRIAKDTSETFQTIRARFVWSDRAELSLDPGSSSRRRRALGGMGRVPAATLTADVGIYQRIDV